MVRRLDIETMNTMRTKTIGQIAHETGERVGKWARKWEHMNHLQRLEWESLAEAVAIIAATEERERLRGYFSEALSDHGIMWPGEVDTLYDRCFVSPYELPSVGLGGSMSNERNDMEFTEFPKMARWSREVFITEKIDGTNAQVCIADDGVSMFVGSRTRWITPEDDNYGFARWCAEHRDELLTLGPGRHFGEWWGSGVQRGYGLTKGDKRFSLFNISRWSNSRPACCHVVPVLYQGPMAPGLMEEYITELAATGSYAAPGFMNPEGIVMFHTAGNFGFKKTIKRDDVPKTLADRQAP